MDLKRFALASLAGSVAMWLLAGLWHMLLVPGFYAVEGEAAHHDGGGLIIVAYLLLGILMAYMYPIGYKGGQPILEGLRFGLLIGLLWVLPHELVMVGAHGGSISYVLINAAWHLLEQGAGGIIMGLVFGRGQAAAPGRGAHDGALRPGAHRPAETAHGVAGEDGRG